MNNTALNYATRFDVKLDYFSGPLDLLLHLVSRQELELEKVRMSEICEQYLEIVLEQAETIDIEKASEYIVIAANLLSIKSSSLLPAEEELDQDDGDSEILRFFESLRARLVEFQKTKLRAEALMHLPQLGVDCFNRKDKSALKPTAEMYAEPEDGLDLGNLFSALMRRIGSAAKSLRILAEPVSVVDLMMKFLDGLSNSEEKVQINNVDKKRSSFFSLLANVIGFSRQKNKQTKSKQKSELRNSLVAGFVAVLELAKRGVIAVNQESQNISMILGLDDAKEAIENLSSSKSVATHNLEEELAIAEGKLVRIDDYKNLKESDTAKEDTAKEENG